MKKNWSLVLISVLVIIISALIFYIVKTSNKDDETPKRKDYIASDTLVNITKSETKDEIIYEVTDNRKNLKYSWTFNKDENLMKSLKDNMEIDMSLKLDVLTTLDNEKLNSITNEDKLIISFEHHGELPTKAKVRINVSDKYKDGELLYLYYLNEEKDQIEYIDSKIPVKHGYVEFEITHCSDYFLTASIVQDAVNNPKNVNLIIIVMVIVIIVLIGATLFQNKK